MRFFTTSLITVSLSISILIQILWGNLPMTWFAFPVNFALLALLVGVCYVLQHEKGSHPWMQDWASARTSIVLFLIALVESLFIAFKPQWDVQQSWPFNVSVLLLLSNLLLVLLRYKGPHLHRFRLNHLGLFLFIASLTFGAPDMHRWKTVLSPGQTAEHAFDRRGVPHALGYPLKLEALDAGFYDNGTPEYYQATVSVQGEQEEIRVNYPWHKSWKEDLYITNYGRNRMTRQPYCVIEFIVQPWKYLTYIGLLLTALGAILLLWGKKTNKKRT